MHPWGWNSTFSIITTTGCPGDLGGGWDESLDCFPMLMLPPHNHHYRSSWLIPSIISFILGVSTASLAFYWSQNRLGNDIDEEEDDDDDELFEEVEAEGNQHGHHHAKKARQRPKAAHRPSLLDWTAVKMITGEPTSPSSSPRTRTPWNWYDRKRSSISKKSAHNANIAISGGASKEGDGSLFNNPHVVHQQEKERPSPQSEHSASTPEFKDSSLCIGSIFGLDVGGTLAKLVYFEQKTEQTERENKGDYSLYIKDRNAKNEPRAATTMPTTSMKRSGRVSLDDQSLPSSQQLLQLQQQWQQQQSWFKGLKSPPPPTTGSTQPLLSTSSATAVATHRPSEEQETPWPPPEIWEKGQQRRKEQKRRHSLLSGSPKGSSSVPDMSDFHSQAEQSVPHKLHSSTPTSLPTPSLPPLAPLSSHHRREKSEGDSKAPKDSGMLVPSAPVTGNMSRCKSMFNLMAASLNNNHMNGMNHTSNQQYQNHAAALDRFYDFARNVLDSYRGGLRETKLSFYSRELGGEFHFIRFETRHMDRAVHLVRSHQLHRHIHEMGATGGGAHKYAQLWQDELGIRVLRQDEMDSLVAGMQFVLSTVVGECYTYQPQQDQPKSRVTSISPSASSLSSSSAHAAGKDVPPVAKSDSVDSSSDNSSRARNGKGDEWWWSRKVQRDAVSEASTYPYMVVSIGTGVSILRVDGPRRYERVSGSTIGGGTYWGLIRLLTDVEEFEDVMRLAERGDPSKVDMMVGDIYGENSDALERLGLPANLVASSFGKLVAKDDPAEGLKQEDLARALLLMITNNIGQVAYLNAKLMKTRQIYFIGNFLRQNIISQRRLSSAIQYWSKGEMEALFLEHEGYFGALGAFLLSQNIPHPGSHHFWHTQKSMPSSLSSQDDTPTPKEPLHRRSVTLHRWY